MNTNIAVGQKYRTKDRKDCLAEYTFEVLSLVEQHNFGVNLGTQPGVVVTIKPGHKAMFALNRFESKFELITA